MFLIHSLLLSHPSLVFHQFLHFSSSIAANESVATSLSNRASGMHKFYLINTVIVVLCNIKIPLRKLICATDWKRGIKLLNKMCWYSLSRKTPSRLPAAISLFCRFFRSVSFWMHNTILPWPWILSSMLNEHIYIFAYTDTHGDLENHRSIECNANYSAFNEVILLYRRYHVIVFHFRNVLNSCVFG